MIETLDVRDLSDEELAVVSKLADEELDAALDASGVARRREERARVEWRATLRERERRAAL